MGRLVVAEYDGHPNYALVADGADFDRVAIPHGVDERCDTCCDEVDTIDRTIRLTKVVPIWELNSRQMWPKPPAIVRGQ